MKTAYGGSPCGFDQRVAYIRKEAADRSGVEVIQDVPFRPDRGSFYLHPRAARNEEEDRVCTLKTGRKPRGSVMKVRDFASIVGKLVPAQRAGNERRDQLLAGADPAA